MAKSYVRVGILEPLARQALQRGFDIGRTWAVPGAPARGRWRKRILTGIVALTLAGLIATALWLGGPPAYRWVTEWASTLTAARPAPATGLAISLTETNPPDWPDATNRALLIAKAADGAPPPLWTTGNPVPVKANTVARISSADLGDHLWVNIRQPDGTEQRRGFPAESVASRQAFLLNYDGDVQLSFWIPRPCTIVVETLSFTPQEVEQQIQSAGGTIDP